MAFFIFDISTTLFDKTKFDEERLIAFGWFLDALQSFNHTDRLFTFFIAFMRRLLVKNINGKLCIRISAI